MEISRSCCVPPEAERLIAPALPDTSTPISTLYSSLFIIGFPADKKIPGQTGLGFFDRSYLWSTEDMWRISSTILLE